MYAANHVGKLVDTFYLWILSPHLLERD
jgi:hypothetical protein